MATSTTGYEIGSERVDTASGVRHQAAFLPLPDGLLFAVVALPDGTPRGGVVICSPVKAELMQNYRRELALATRLAEAGYATLRFQYRGTGNSTGSESGLTLDSMIADADLAATALAQRFELRRVGFVGTRLGALAAAGAARRRPGAPLVLWEPVSRTDRYFREVFRYRLISDLKRGEQGEQVSSQEILGELERSGRTEVAGFAIHRQLFESCRGRDLRSELRDPKGSGNPLLLLQVSRSATIRSEYEKLRQQLSELGHTAETLLVRGEIAWWFQGGAGEEATEDLNTATVRWLVPRLAGGDLAAGGTDDGD